MAMQEYPKTYGGGSTSTSDTIAIASQAFSSTIAFLCKVTIREPITLKAGAFFYIAGCCSKAPFSMPVLDDSNVEVFPAIINTALAGVNATITAVGSLQLTITSPGIAIEYTYELEIIYN